MAPLSEPAEQTEQAGTAGQQPPLPAPGEKRRLDLHRRRAVITANRIDVRPSREAVLPPLFGLLLGLGCVSLIILGVTAGAVPYWALALLLLVALLAVPLSGITLVYALVGANVIFDRKKQSGSFQQGFLGMGIGTTDLVPFWKIEAIAVTEAGTVDGTAGGRTEEFAQWEAVLLKQSGTRLRIAGMTVPRQFASAGLASVKELADALAALTGAPVRYETAPSNEDEPEPPTEQTPDDTTEPVRSARRLKTAPARRRRRG
jgi:hypothetical protein